MMRVQFFLLCFIIFFCSCERKNSLLNSPSIPKSLLRVPEDYPSIQGAIDQAVHGDTILVAPGSYPENIHFLGKNIVVASHFLVSGDTSLISRTIISGNHSGKSVVTFSTGQDSTSQLIGLTITAGSVDNGSGGGIWCYSSSPVIKNCDISGNWARSSGGGIFCDNSSARFINCNISNNSTNGYGGGIFSLSSAIRVINSVIVDNAAHFGGGLTIDWSGKAQPTIRNTLIIGNTAQQDGGGALCWRSGNGFFFNCTFSKNAATNAGGGLKIYDTGAHPALVNCILWNNTPQEIDVDNVISLTTTNCIVRGGWPGSMNMNCNPEFLDPEHNDFQLRETSPSIDAGTSVFTWGGDTILNIQPGEFEGNAPDMGAIESPYVSTKHCFALTLQVPPAQLLIQKTLGVISHVHGDTFIVDTLMLQKTFPFFSPEVRIAGDTIHYAGEQNIETLKGWLTVDSLAGRLDFFYYHQSWEAYNDPGVIGYWKEERRFTLENVPYFTDSASGALIVDIPSTEILIYLKDFYYYFRSLYDDPYGSQDEQYYLIELLEFTAGKSFHLEIEN